MIGGSITDDGREFSVRDEVHTGSGGPTSLLSEGAGGLAVVCEGGHTPLSFAGG